MFVENIGNGTYVNKINDEVVFIKCNEEMVVDYANKITKRYILKYGNSSFFDDFEKDNYIIEKIQFLNESSYLKEITKIYKRDNENALEYVKYTYKDGKYEIFDTDTLEIPIKNNDLKSMYGKKLKDAYKLLLKNNQNN